MTTSEWNPASRSAVSIAQAEVAARLGRPTDSWRLKAYTITSKVSTSSSASREAPLLA
jgi:hypothetical protein